MRTESLDFFSNSTCTVKTMNDIFLFTGVVNSVSYTDKVIIKIAPKDGEALQLVEYGLSVKIVLRKNNKFIVISGNVYASSRELCAITDVTNIQEKERRRYFRVSSSINALATEVLTPEQLEEKEEFFVPESHHIRLMDISLTGIKFFSQANFEPGSTVKTSDLMLVSTLPLFILDCKIIDKIPTTDGFIYRTTISDLSPLVTDLLCKAIFELERNVAKKRSKR